MKRSTVIWLAAILAAAFLIVNVFAEEAVVESFRGALRNGNSREIRALTAGGLIVARLYNRNSSGRLFRVNEIPDNLQVSVPNEFPFDLRYLFGGSIRSRSVRYLEQRMYGAVFEENLAALHQFAQQVTEFANQRTPSFTPTVIHVNDRYLVLTEAEFNDGILTGTVAVFERRGGQGSLKAIIDLR